MLQQAQYNCPLGRTIRPRLVYSISQTARVSAATVSNRGGKRGGTSAPVEHGQMPRATPGGERIKRRLRGVVRSLLPVSGVHYRWTGIGKRSGGRTNGQQQHDYFFHG